MATRSGVVKSSTGWLTAREQDCSPRKRMDQSFRDRQPDLMLDAGVQYDRPVWQRRRRPIDARRRGGRPSRATAGASYCASTPIPVSTSVTANRRIRIETSPLNAGKYYMPTDAPPDRWQAVGLEPARLDEGAGHSRRGSSRPLTEGPSGRAGCRCRGNRSLRRCPVRWWSVGPDWHWRVARHLRRGRKCRFPRWC